MMPTHHIYVFFVWILEQRAIISLYSINCLVFTAQMECVHCAVWTESLRLILVFKEQEVPTLDVMHFRRVKNHSSHRLL